MKIEINVTTNGAMPHKWGYEVDNLKTAIFVIRPDGEPFLLEQTCAARDVLAERQRQVQVEGWTTEHDDEEHDTGDLAAAACAYALYAADALNPCSQGDGDYGREQPVMWPFPGSWWKPQDPRHALVKAGALILAEIERIDRQAAKEELS